MSYKVEVIKGFEDEFEKFVRKLDKSSQARLVRLIDLLKKTRYKFRYALC